MTKSDFMENELSNLNFRNTIGRLPVQPDVQRMNLNHRNVSIYRKKIQFGEVFSTDFKWLIEK